jgi:hypothetical protein
VSYGTLNGCVRAVRAAVGVAAAASLAGCASSVYEGKYDWRDGWRAAEVVRVQTAAEMERPRFYECVRKASPEQLANTRFAVVKYRAMSRTRWRAVPLPPGSRVAAGDRVYVDVGNCGATVADRN